MVNQGSRAGSSVSNKIVHMIRKMVGAKVRIKEAERNAVIFKLAINFMIAEHFRGRTLFSSGY